MAEIIHATRTLSSNGRLPFAESHKFRIRRRRNFDSAVAESTYEWISPIVYVTLWIMWWGQHWVVIEEVIMSHPHPHLGNAPHNVVQRCPYAQLTVRSRQLNLRRAIFCPWEDIYTSTRNADIISSGARKWISEAKRARKKIRECINNLLKKNNVSSAYIIDTRWNDASWRIKCITRRILMEKN